MYRFKGQNDLCISSFYRPPDGSYVNLPVATHVKLHKKLLFVLDDAGLSDSATPIWNLLHKNNSLDLLPTNSPKAVYRSETILGLSDHDAIFAEIDKHPHINEITSRKIMLNSGAEKIIPSNILKKTGP